LAKASPGRSTGLEAPRCHGQEVRTRLVIDRIVSDKTFWNATFWRSFFSEIFWRTLFFNQISAILEFETEGTVPHT